MIEKRQHHRTVAPFGTGTPVLSARVMGGATFENTDAGGDDGWMLPNSITCDDRPPVVPPPPPSGW